MELDNDIKQRLKDYINKAPKVKTVIHWWDLYPIRSVKIKPELQVEIVKLAIKKAASQEKVAKVINVKQATISKWLLLQRDIFISNLVKLCNFVGYPFDKVERNVIKISGLKYPNLPFNLTSPEAIKIRAAFLSDGHIPRKITGVPHYKSDAIEAHRNLILWCKKVFGNFGVKIKFIKNDHVFVTKFPSIIGDALELSGIPRGDKAFINPFVPGDIILGVSDLKKYYLQQVFDDEGSVSIEKRAGGKVILSRSNIIGKNNDLKRRYTSNRRLNPGFLKKCRKEINNLICGESLLLNLLGIETKLYTNGVWKNKKGTVSAQWRLEISTKKDLENFQKNVGFTLNDKKRKLKRLINGVRYSFHNHEGIEFTKIKIFEINKNGIFKFRDLAQIFQKENRCISLTSCYIKKLETGNFIKKVRQGVYQLIK
jgi:transcriptional regulator with XRE-family HTH domain